MGDRTATKAQLTDFVGSQKAEGKDWIQVPEFMRLGDFTPLERVLISPNRSFPEGCPLPPCLLRRIVTSCPELMPANKFRKIQELDRKNSGKFRSARCPYVQRNINSQGAGSSSTSQLPTRNLVSLTPLLTKTILEASGHLDI